MVRVAPYDGIDYGAWVQSASVTIGNSVPTIPTAVTFAPTAPKTGDAITATATGATDIDGDLLTAASYQYLWFKSIDEGLNYSPTVFTANTLPAGNTTSGEWWTVETWANDGFGDGVHFTSAPVVIGNAVPSAPTVGLTPATPRSKDDLHALASDSVDPEGVPVTYGYRWLRSIDGGATWTVVSNPGGATLAAAKIKRGEVWKVQARATDGLAFGRWATSNLVTIGNTVPETSKVKWGIVPTVPTVSDTLQAWASGATDRDGDAITYDYQWSVSGDGGTTWSAWSEHTGQTLTGVTLVRGQVWRMRVRAVDGIGVSAWKTPSKSVTIIGKTPTAPAQVVIAPLSPTSSSDLTATASGSTDPDGDLVTYQFEWASSTNGGRTWSAWGNPGATLDHALITRDELWKARARASDGALVSGWVQSSSVTILNAAPAAPTVSIAPLGPTPNQDLTATAHSTDADGDVITYVYQWSRSTNGGTTWDAWSSTGSVLTKDMTELRDMWRVRAMATDGTLSSAWAVSAPVTILGMFANQDPQPNAFSGPRDYLSFTFRQAVDEASAESSFSLTAAGGMPVTGTFVWTTPNLAMRFVPNTPLTMATSYTVTMASGVTLIGGGTYDWTESFNFTSSSAPVVTAASPTGAGVLTSTVVTVTFDQNMKKTSTLAAFTINPAVAGTPTLLGKTLIFTPAVGLAANTPYTVTVAKTALSSSNLPMHGAYSWTFTTAAAAPVSMSAAVARTAGGAQINVNLSAAAEVSVVICNVAGRVVAQLPGRALPAGVSTLLWNGRSSAGTAVPSGVYLVHVEGSSPDGGRSNCLTTLRQ